MNTIHETSPEPVKQSPEVVGDSWPKSKRGCFRRSREGQKVIHEPAWWVAERLAKSGMTFEQWMAMGCKPSQIGCGKASAIAELKSRIEDAHLLYNQSGDGRQYLTWEEYWTGSLANRMHYFFRRHVPGAIVPCLAEWLESCGMGN